MNEAEDHWEAIVRGLIEGDPLVCTEFWKNYGERLSRLADRRLPEGLRRRVEPEDIVQSACRSFFRRVQERKLELDDPDMLWPLLCAITINKVRRQIRFHCRQRRDSRREQGVQAGADEPMQPQDFLTSGDPSPEHVAMFSEQMHGVLSVLSEQECVLLEMKLEAYSNQEVADRLLCSERTVRRMLTGIRGKLRDSLLESSS
jgi:RNA polymerase sigma factor (sigma-70 family)